MLSNNNLCNVLTFLFPFFCNTWVALPVKEVYITSLTGSIFGKAEIINLTNVDFPVPT